MAQAQVPLVHFLLENDPSITDAKAQEWEHFWTDVHAMAAHDKRQPPQLTFEVVSDHRGAYFYLSVPAPYAPLVAKKLNAVYPYIEIREVTDPTRDWWSRYAPLPSSSYELRLREAGLLPLKVKGMDKHFLNSLLNSMNHPEGDHASLVQYVIVPRVGHGGQRWRRWTLTTLGALWRTLAFLISEKPPSPAYPSRVLPRPEQVSWQKGEHAGFHVAIRVAAWAPDPLVAEDTSRSIAAVFKELDERNGLVPVRVNLRASETREVGRSWLSSNELAQCLYLPTKTTLVDNVVKGNVRLLYDKNVASEGLVFGESNGRPVAFPMVKITQASFESRYPEIERMVDNNSKARLILGQPGTGKSEFIVNYILQLINMGISVILVDPKHDTQRRLIETIPDAYLPLVDYIDLGDPAYPAPMNMLRLRNPGDQTEISIVTQSFINFMKKLYGNAWGYSMQLLIQNAVNTIMLLEIHTLYELRLLLENQEFRQRVLGQLKVMLEDPQVTGKTMVHECYEFWTAFNRLTPDQQQDRVKPTMNRLGLFVSNRLISAIVSQREGYDFREAGDRGRITIINLSEGILTPENTAIMSSFINKTIWLDYQSRANEPNMAKRYPVSWIIDEAHSLVDEEFIGVLTKARSYRLGVTLITQGISNFKQARVDGLDEIILTNCKSKICFRLGALDARMMAEEFAPLGGLDLANIPDYHFYGKLLLGNGQVSNPFYCSSPPVAPVVRNYEDYVAHHRTGRLTIDEIEEERYRRYGLRTSYALFAEEPPKRGKRAKAREEDEE